MKTITICSSAAFYEHVNVVASELESAGYTVFIPKTAKKMHDSGDFDVTHYKTWYSNDEDWHKKAELMRAHFDEVARGDITLVVNDEKHGIANYIGGNVLMEMSLAFYLRKPIYLWNGLPNSDSSTYEEVRGMGSVPLQGDIQKLLVHLADKTA